MKIISWNVNGIRAIEKKGVFDALLAMNADIVCLQETKAHKEQLSAALTHPENYVTFFHSATSRKGYSGTAVYVKKGIHAQEIQPPVSFLKKDLEGRLIVLELSDFFLINCYFPNGGGESHRLAYKLAFFDAFTEMLTQLQKTKPVIFCGDVNIAHAEIDLARPKENVKSIGFLPEERAKIDAIIAHSFSDVHRTLHPNIKDIYTWWDMKTRSREKNVGWRIDYFFVSNTLMPRVKKINTHTRFLGSDHCPVEIEMK